MEEAGRRMVRIPPEPSDTNGLRGHTWVSIAVVITLVALASLLFSFTGLLVRSVYVTVPVIIALIIWLLEGRAKVTSMKEIQQEREPRRLAMLMMAFMVLEMLSAIVAVLARQRTAIYFLFQLSAIVVLVVQSITIVDWKMHRKWMVLVQTGIFVSMGTLTKTMIYTRYIGNGDISFHEHAVESILVSGRIPSDLQIYSHFPILHTLSASISSICSLTDTLFAMRILFGICAFFLPMAIFSISMRLSAKTSLSMIAALLCSTGFILLWSLSEGVPGMLVFVFFIFMLQVTMRPDGKSRAGFAGIGIIFAVVVLLSHLVMSLYVACLLFVVGLSYTMIVPTGGRRTNVSVRVAVILAFAFFAYVTYVSLDVIELLLSRTVPEAGSASLSTISSELPSLRLLAYNQFLRIGYSIMLFLAVLGMLKVALGKGSSLKRNSRGLLLAFGVAGLFFYIPGLFQLFPYFVYRLELPRFSIFGELMVALLASLAAWDLLKKTGPRRVFLIVVVVSIAVAGGMIAPENTADITVLEMSSVHSRPILYEQDIAAFQFLMSESNQTLIETDYFSWTYLNARGIPTTIAQAYKNGSIQFGGNHLVYLRSGQLATNGLSFYDPYNRPGATSSMEILSSNSDKYRDHANVLCDYGQSVVGQWFERSYVPSGQ